MIPCGIMSNKKKVHKNATIGRAEIYKGKPPKKTGKKVHNSCELSPKMANPPSPYFTTNLADFGT